MAGNVSTLHFTNLGRTSIFLYEIASSGTHHLDYGLLRERLHVVCENLVIYVFLSSRYEKLGE